MTGFPGSSVCIAGAAAGDVALAELPSWSIGTEDLDFLHGVGTELVVEASLDGRLEESHLGGPSGGVGAEDELRVLEPFGADVVGHLLPNEIRPVRQDLRNLGAGVET